MENERAQSVHSVSTASAGQLHQCAKCDDTGYKDHAGFSVDPCPHDDQPTALERAIIDAMAGKHLVTAGEIAAAIVAAETAIAGDGGATTAEHPNAQDYRNRAERAEAECAELRAALATVDRDARPDNWDDEPGAHADAWRLLDKALGK
ncbi:hypothetical protein [Novosphingobium resinovorum]|uniref:Uncharacterized protein n=1 Tax=Novosphingobium resinovorum TaxID=158500 RepID=A0A1D8A579_9SPHN|nr:hypothetical protein [Novosphingobium resinovorum]AOR77242.1 hypothetical protein BES08_11125 [Novosphingobium resinovorum]